MPTLVLDTNIVLDWLLFKHRSMEALQQGVERKRLALMASPLAFDELARVLAYPQFRIDDAGQQVLLETYRACTTVPSLPEGLSRENLFLPAQFPRCRDRDDEHFIALAYHGRADALITKDKVVLKLGKRVKKFGVRILNVPQMVELIQE